MLGNVDGAGQKYGDPRPGRTHVGYDIGTAGVAGRPVVAASDGQVSISSAMAGRGTYVLIDHGDGIRTLYQHLASSAVAVGQPVTAGQRIGICGATGGDFPIHLHLEVFTSGGSTSTLSSQTVDPKQFFLARGVTLGKSTPLSGSTPVPVPVPTPGTDNQEDPMFVAFNKNGGPAVLVYPSGKWALVTDGADAAAMKAAGIPSIDVSGNTFTNLTPPAAALSAG
jgi:murein DD-endopeptidase MepM/ murein hydrolase activator NlpD